jgi:hypothetical protein
MPDPVPNAEVLRSLGRLVRGLSALFWGLPSALIVCFYTARAEGIRAFGIMPPLVCAGWLAYGLWQLGAFQKRERVWRNTLDRAQLLSVINLGLSPFLYWSSRVPANGFFFLMVLVLALCGLLFLGSLNQVLQRLGAMLPDEALRLEIKQFTALNLNLLTGMLALALAYVVLVHLHKTMPHWAQRIAVRLNQNDVWYLVPIIPLVLLPVAMTMALLWKTKQVILDSVFGTKFQA